MRLTIAFVAAALAVSAAGIVHAADDPITARQALMKKNGAAVKTALGFIKGETPYDAAKAADAMKDIADDLTTFVTLFPEGSDKGGDTTASPAIWTDMAGFKALADKTVADATLAQNAAAGGLDSFKTAFATVGGDCQACHQKYRVKK
ncbi:MAG: cytochrome c [Rhizobiales bacterium]|nr:cytochrome c [Hyphomicrobiales bacterium]